MTLPRTKEDLKTEALKYIMKKASAIVFVESLSLLSIANALQEDPEPVKEALESLKVEDKIESITIREMVYLPENTEGKTIKRQIATTRTVTESPYITTLITLGILFYAHPYILKILPLETQTQVGGPFVIFVALGLFIAFCVHSAIVWLIVRGARSGQ